MRHAHQAHETKAAVDHNLPDDHCDTDRQHHQPLDSEDEQNRRSADQHLHPNPVARDGR